MGSAHFPLFLLVFTIFDLHLSLCLLLNFFSASFILDLIALLLLIYLKVRVDADWSAKTVESSKTKHTALAGSLVVRALAQ